MMSDHSTLCPNGHGGNQVMRDPANFLAQFIGEQVEMLAKMARVDGLDDLAFKLQQAKAEADLTQKRFHESHEHAPAN